jgi:hypothetical protein
VITDLAAFATRTAGAQRIRLVRGYRKRSAPFVKNRRREAPQAYGKNVSLTGEASLQRWSGHHKLPESGRISRICLECAAIFGHLR